LEAAPLQEAASFIDQYRQHWEQSFDRLNSYLQQLQAQETKSKPKEK
jgi:hypothetical protein